MTNEYAHTSKGLNDECYTPRYGVEPLLDYLEPYKNQTIWCPFDDETSEFVKVFSENNFRVVYSHIKNNQDYFKYEPQKWDLMISNPPFTNKTATFKRALSFNKPFALLMTMLWLNDATPAKIFSNHDLQLLTFTERMQFKNRTHEKKINFMSAYFCWNFLPKQICISNFKSRNQMRLF